MTVHSLRLLEDEAAPGDLERTLTGWLTLRRWRFWFVSAAALVGEGVATSFVREGRSMLTRGVGDDGAIEPNSIGPALAFSVRRFVGVVVVETDVDCGLTRDLPSEGGGVDWGERVLVGIRAFEMVRNGRRDGEVGRAEGGVRDVVEPGEESFGRRDLLKGR